jgi:hypothetical protein
MTEPSGYVLEPLRRPGLHPFAGSNPAIYSDALRQVLGMVRILGRPTLRY